MSKLREKMIRAMELKNLSKHTQKAYLAAVTGLAKHYHKSPQKITKHMIEDYLLYLKNVKGPQLVCLRFDRIAIFLQQPHRPKHHR
jgi:hypothetical protein